MFHEYNMDRKKTLELVTSKNWKFGWRVRQGSKYYGCDLRAMSKVGTWSMGAKERHRTWFCAGDGRLPEKGLFQSTHLLHLCEVRGIGPNDLFSPFTEFCDTECGEWILWKGGLQMNCSASLSKIKEQKGSEEPLGWFTRVTNCSGVCSILFGC